MPSITDAQRVVEACHDALSAALQSVRAEAELSPDADNLALQTYEACLVAADVGWNVYAGRRNASLDAAQQHKTDGAGAETHNTNR